MWQSFVVIDRETSEMTHRNKKTRSPADAKIADQTGRQ